MSFIHEVVDVLEDAGLWIDQMQVGVNKWAGDAVGLLARQDNLNAFKNGDLHKALVKARTLAQMNQIAKGDGDE